MKSLLLAIMLVAGVAQAQYLVPGNGDSNNGGNNNQNCAGQNKEKKKHCQNNNNNQNGNNGGQHTPNNNGGHQGNQGPQYPGNNGGYLVPGNGNSDTHNGNNGHNNGPSYPSYPSNPYQPYPSNPYPSNPYYGSDYGQAYTYRWQDMGVFKVEKVIGETIRIYAGNRLVNEVLLRSSEADTQVIRAYARLSSGQILQLPAGVVRQGSDVRLRIDRNYSVRIDSIEIQATSQNLFGSRARLQVWFGLAD